MIADPDRSDRKQAGEGKGEVRPRGQTVRGARGARDQAEEEERADGLGGLGGDDAEQDEEHGADERHRYASSNRDLRVDRREKERPRDHEHCAEDAKGDPGCESGLGGAEAEDRSEERSSSSDPVAAAAAAREDIEEEDPETEDPDEDDSDRDVVGARSFPEGREQQRDENGGGEEADTEIEADRRRGQGTREGDVAEGITGEDLASEHDEVADCAAGERGRRPGEQRVANELLPEHQLVASSSTTRSVCLSRRTADRAPRART